MESVADEVHFPKTADGWRLAMHRYRSRQALVGAPVILCGGYACNRYFMDYDDDYSLARFLARRGFDAWVLELRGRGVSHPGPECRSSRAWTFDDLVEFDVPAAITHVAGATGQGVMWVGHSMGGMLLYAHCGLRAPEYAPLRAAVTLASPVTFPRGASETLSRLGMFALSVPFSDTIRQRWALGALWVLLGRSSVIAVGMNPENVDRRTVGRALRLSLENVSRLKLQQFAHWAREGIFCSADGRIDYRDALTRVRLPMLAIAGRADRIAVPESVAMALRHLPDTMGTYLEMGRAQGYSADYGHVDLILGRRAPTEIFPVIAGWLSTQSRAGDDAGAG